MRAGFDPLEHQVVGVVGRQDDDARGGQFGAQLARGGDAAQARHFQVHQDNVGRELARRRRRLGAIGGLAHHLDPLGVAEDGSQPLANDLLVIYEQDANHSLSPQ